VTAKVFPLLEVTDDGKTWKIWKDFEPSPIKDYLMAQGRFRHLGEEDLRWVEEETEKYWQYLLSRERLSLAVPGLDAE
jgi:pyruvate/2-oxoacid:ferredoxin oxidoreductase beta subunit